MQETNEYTLAKLEPFKPRQCMHWNSDGIRCRAYARHNDHTCFQHRVPDEPYLPVIANEPFTLPSLHTHDGILDALDVIAAHVSGKTIDDRRANLLLYTIQLASNRVPRPAAALADSRQRPTDSAHPGPQASDLAEPGVPSDPAIPSQSAHTASRAVEELPDTPPAPTAPTAPTTQPLSPEASTPTTGEQPPTDNAQPATDSLQPPTSNPPREYSILEEIYLTFRVVKGENLAAALANPDRPTSLSDDDIRAYYAYARPQLDAEKATAEPVTPAGDDQSATIIAPRSSTPATPPPPAHRSPQSAQSTAPLDAAP